MVLSVKAAAHAGYYDQTTGLEMHEAYAKGKWLKGVKFGVDTSQPVQKEDLDHLLNRRLLGSQSKKGAAIGSGHDFVFSAPKSVSLVWAFTENPSVKSAIESAQYKAVWLTAALLLQTVIKERRGKGGLVLKDASGISAVFMHVTARFALHQNGAWFPDPNLHCHVVVPDLCINEEGRTKVPYTALYRHSSMALGAWYHACLAYRLRQAGIPLKPSGENGLFQIEGIDPAWITNFSARTQGPKFQIRVLPDKILGHEKAKLLQQTRAPYQPIGAGDLKKAWHTHAAANGLDPSKILNSQQRAPSRALSLRRDPPGNFYRDIVEEATKSEAVVQSHHLLRALAAQLVASSTHLRPSLRLFRELCSQDLLEELEPTRSYKFQQWTSRSNADDEIEAGEIAKYLVTAPFPGAGTFRRDDPGPSNFNAEQWNAIEAATAPDCRLVVIEGAPGTGKTSLLGPVVAAYQAQHGGASVIGAAESWRTAVALKETFGIEAYALTAFFAKLASGGLWLGRQTVLIIDEAGLLSTKRTLQILRLVRTAKAKLILLGDERQLNPIGAGSGLRLVKQHALPHHVKQLVRQPAGVQRELVEAFINGEMTRLADLLASEQLWQSRATSEDAVTAIVEEILPAFLTSQNASMDMLAIVRSNRELHHVSRRLRKRLREAGLISGPDLAVHGVTPMGCGVRFQLAKGDHIRFLVRNDSYGVINGSQAMICSIDPDAGPELNVQISNDAHPDKPHQFSFKLCDFKDKKGRVRIAPAYASTVYGCQGMTVEKAVILKSAPMTLRELYVAVTRARRTSRIFDVNPIRARLRHPEDGHLLVRSLYSDLVQARRRDTMKMTVQDIGLPNRVQETDRQCDDLLEAKLQKHAARSDDQIWRRATR